MAGFENLWEEPGIRRRPSPRPFAFRRPSMRTRAFRTGAQVGQALMRPGEMRRRAVQRRTRAGFPGGGISPMERRDISQHYQTMREQLPRQQMWMDILRRYYKTMTPAQSVAGHRAATPTGGAFGVSRRYQTGRGPYGARF